MNNTKQVNILKKFELKPEMVWKTSEPYIFNESRFLVYHPKTPKSEIEKELDEIYQFSDRIVLHRETGLRVHYSEHESYFGDTITYKVYYLFVIDVNGNRKNIVDVNLPGGFFLMEDGPLFFSDVNKDIE
ncbi:MAG: hypothetical protein ACR2KB_00795 [Chitinophagaceae bacterium]